MRIIKRKMVIDEQISIAEHNIDEYLPYCQASFNSDGNITLRNYDRSNKDKDEIIILSNAEVEGEGLSRWCGINNARVGC